MRRSSLEHIGPPPREPGPWFPRWLAGSLAIGTLALLAGAAWLYKTQQAEVQRQAESQLEAVAAFKVGQIADWRANQLAEARELAEGPGLIEGVAQWLARPRPEADSDILTRFRSRQQHYGYTDVVLLDPSGAARLSLSGRLAPAHSEWTAALVLAASERRCVLTDLQAEPEVPTPHLAAVAPLFADQGRSAELVGGVALLSDARQFLYPTIQAWPTLSATAETLLVRRDGDGVLFLSDLRHRSDVALKLRIPLADRRVPAVRAVLGEVGVVRGPDYRGVDALAALKAIPGTPWYLVAKVDAAEALSAWRDRSALILALVLAFVASASAAASHMWRRSAAVHFRRLSQRERELRESEEHFRLLFEQASEAIFLCDSGGHYLDVNLAACQLLGYKRDELLGRTALDFVEPEEAPRLAQEIARLEGGAVVRSEWRCQTKNGSSFRAEIAARQLPDGRLQAFAHDISASSRPGEALREKERVLTESQRIAHIGSWVLHADGRRFWTDETYRLYGVSPDTFIPDGEAVLTLIHPEDRPAMRAWIDACWAGEAPGELQLRVVLPDGSIRFLSGRGELRRDAGRPAYLTGTAQDVTGRKRAEEALRTSEERFHAYVEQASDPLLVHDFSGRFLDVNLEACASLGYSRDELLGMTVFDVETDFDIARAQAAWSQVRPGQRFTLMGHHRRKDGSAFPVEVRFGCFDLDGERRYVGLARDLTERAQAEEEIARVSERLGLAARAARLGIWDWDVVNDRLVWDDRMYELYGVTKDAFAGAYEAWANGLHPDDRARGEGETRRVLRDGGEYNTEFRVLWPDGTVRHLSAHGAVVRDDSGKPLRMVGVNFDITERKQAKQALRDSEARLNEAQHNARIGSWRYLPEGPLLWSDEMFELFKLPRDVPPTYQALVSVIHPQDRAGSYSGAFERALESDAHDFEAEYRVVWPDGQVKTIRTLGTIHREADGRVIEAVGTSQDVTEHRHAEQALRESEERLRLALAAADQGLYDLDVRTGEALVTAEYASMLGYDPTEFNETNARWLERMHPDDREAVAATYRECVDGRIPTYRVEFRQRTADGRWKWILSLGKVVERDDGGRPVRMLGTHTDITLLKHAEAERARLASAIEQVAEAVLITDTQGAIQYVNPAFEAITGYSRDEAIGQNPRMLKSGDHDEAFYRSIWQALSVGEPWTGRFVNRRKNGSLFSDESVISPLRDPRGRIVGYVAVKRDISEQMQRIAEKEKLQAQLVQAQKMESVGRLAGGVAHDFNNMLGVILGRAEMALRGAGVPEATRRDLGEILKATQSSADLTRQLLAFARKQTIQPRVLDLNDTIAGMLKLMRRLIGEDIELVFRPGPGVWMVKIDPSQVDQLLANLIVNARDAIAGTGRIGITTSNAKLDEAQCASRPDSSPGDYAVLTVEDDGSGMDEETISHAFEPFFTTKGEGKGTGLGLATVHGIVNQNSGYVDVRSERGRGTAFRIYLPAVDIRDAAAAAQVAAGPPPAGDETLLLVEDDDALLAIAKEVLEELGYRVLTASVPTDAIRVAAEEGGIDLLITDVVMPQMNGRELADRLLADRPGLRCLFMSGYTADVIAPHGVLDESMHFIQKPFSARGLAEKVREALGHRRRS